MKRCSWIVAGNTTAGGYFVECLRCDKREEIAVPTPVESFVLRLKAFSVEHERCEPKTGG